jgi:tetratricopeptide (TPR) repeat protein
MSPTVPDLSEAAVREQLDRVLASPYFANSNVRTRFLRFVVEETLAGRGDELREIVIGVHVFKPDYNPQADNHVRRHAPDVRRCLRQYYETSGNSDPIVIELSPGRYTPALLPKQNEPGPRTPPHPLWRWIIAGIAAGFLLAFVFSDSRQWILDELGWLPSEKHLVVLPFHVTGSDELQRAFGEGLREAVVMKLRQAESFEPNLWVVPTSDVGRQPVTNAREARRAFRATLVLTADLNVTSGRAGIGVTLENAQSGRTLKRRRLEATGLAQLRDPFETAVVRLLKLRISPSDLQLLNADRSSVPNANMFYVTALGYLSRGRDTADEAIGLFTRAVETDPGFALAQNGLAEGYLLKHDVRQDPHLIELAEKSCNTALRINTALAPLHLTLGRIYHLKSQYKEAEQEYWKALGIDSHDAEAYERLGLAQQKLLKHEEAEKTYRQAIALRPDMWSGYVSLGLYYYYRGRLADAETQLQRAKEIAPDNRVVYLDLAAVYIKKEADPEAERALTKCLAIRPDRPDPDCINNLGNLLHFQGRHDAAVPYFERSIQIVGPSALRLWNLSAAYRWSTNPTQRAKARGILEQAVQQGVKELKLNPNDAELHARLALCYAHLDQTARALDEVMVARQLDKNAVVLFQSVRIFERIGRRDDAIAANRDLWAMNGGRTIREIRRDPDLAEFRKDPRYKEVEASSKPL